MFLCYAAGTTTLAPGTTTIPIGRGKVFYLVPNNEPVVLQCSCAVAEMFSLH